MGHLVSPQPPEELQCDLARVSASVSTALEGCHGILLQALLSSLFACRCKEANDKLSTGFLTGAPEWREDTCFGILKQVDLPLVLTQMEVIK